MAEEEKQIDDKQVSTEGAPTPAVRRSRRVQKIGIVASDKMQRTVVVRVDRLVLHRKYRRYVRRTSKFMAHDEVGSCFQFAIRNSQFAIPKKGFSYDSDADVPGRR